MQMTEVREGMRLISDDKHEHGWTNSWERGRIIRVTAILPGLAGVEPNYPAFRYDFEDGEFRTLHARLQMVAAPNGHIHYGINGVCMFRPVEMSDEDPNRQPEKH